MKIAASSTRCSSKRWTEAPMLLRNTDLRIMVQNRRGWHRRDPRHHQCFPPPPRSLAPSRTAPGSSTPTTPNFRWASCQHLCGDEGGLLRLGDNTWHLSIAFWSWGCGFFLFILFFSVSHCSFVSIFCVSVVLLHITVLSLCFCAYLVLRQVVIWGCCLGGCCHCFQVHVHTSHSQNSTRYWPLFSQLIKALLYRSSD